MPTDWQIKRDSFDHRIVPGLARELWNGNPSSLRWISQDYNIVYRFESAGKGFYLRICHTDLHTLPEARQVMHFLCHLAKERAPVAEPVASVNGAFIELLADGFYAAAQKEAPGDEMRKHILDLSVYEAWGRSLGKLHAASRRYQPDPAIPYDFPSVQRFWHNIEPTASKASAQVQRIYAELTDFMNSLPRQDFGLIHGDYRPGNVIWDGTTARAIDFDEPNYHWYIADVSRALMELSDQPHERRRKFRDAFMAGYLSEHQIDDFWVTQLPTFGQHRAMLMHMWDVQEGGGWSEIVQTVLERVEW